MVFPWVGLFEQVALADVFVHYDDVQLPQGRSFITRVQIKTGQGVQWLTVPVKRVGGPQLIKDVVLDDGQDWRSRHRKFLQHTFAGCAFQSDVRDLIDDVYAYETTSLAEFNRRGIERVADYFDLRPRFALSSEFGTPESSTEKLVHLVRRLGGSVYVTGHGAWNYLDHEAFEKHGIRVEYMSYRKLEYPQRHGPFTPFVSILDLIANRGRAGREMIASGTVYWKEYHAA